MTLVKGFLAGVILAAVTVFGGSSAFAAEGTGTGTTTAPVHHRNHHKAKHAVKTVAAHHITTTKDAHGKAVAASSKVAKPGAHKSTGTVAHAKKSTHGVVPASTVTRSAAHTTCGKAVDTKKAAGKHVASTKGAHKSTARSTRVVKRSVTPLNPVTETSIPTESAHS